MEQPQSGDVGSCQKKIIFKQSDYNEIKKKEIDSKIACQIILWTYQLFRIQTPKKAKKTWNKW